MACLGSENAEETFIARLASRWLTVSTATMAEMKVALERVSWQYVHLFDVEAYSKRRLSQFIHSFIPIHSFIRVAFNSKPFLSQMLSR